MLAGPPVVRGDDEVADVPVDVGGEEILDMADIAIRRVDVIAVHLDDAAQMRIALAGIGSHVGRRTLSGFGEDRL